MSADSFYSVTSYSMVSAQLTVQHNFPKTSEMMAIVDVHLILEKLDAEKIATGQWVNIIGYITASPPKSANKTQKFEREVPTVHVQALALWSAGPLDIARYEICLVDMGKTNESAVVKREKPDTI